jgi:hypothetical protein
MPIEIAPTNDNAKCFGLRVERHVLQIAVATRLEDGRHRLEIDRVSCPSDDGWLSATGSHLLTAAISELADRYEMRRSNVAVSLDGDFCVTRVAIGTSEEIDEELSMLAVRVPRYLQLGPGEKVTGECRDKISSNEDYAVTGVVNRSLIQLIYDAFRTADVDVRWVEPSLVSVARLVGQSEIGGDKPIAIADGTGTQWDVGIACSGRLLLDYRPASATTVEALRGALEGHFSRLKRFCHRHRGVSTGELSRLMICGTGNKPDEAVIALQGSAEIEPEILRVPNLRDLYEIDLDQRGAESVPAVSTVLPLLIGVTESDVPDLLDQVRRAPEQPMVTRMIRSAWPVAAAILILCITYGLVSKQRFHRSHSTNDRAEMKRQIDATNVRFTKLAQKRELVNFLTQIRGQTAQPNWNLMLGRVTQSLPDTARLNEFRVESAGEVVLTGTVLDESVVYELVNHFRHLPEVREVALTGTTPNDSGRGIQFAVRLSTSKLAIDSNGSSNDE